MRCASEQELAAYADGDLTPALRQKLADHLQHCGRCRAGVERLGHVAALVSELPTQDHDDAFARDLLARVRQAETTPTTPKRAWLWQWGWAALAAPALAVAVVLWMLPNSPVHPEFVARGSNATTATAQLGVAITCYLHSHPEAGVALLEGMRVHPDDGYSFVVFNRSNQLNYLVIFAQDAAGVGHWIYPERNAGAALGAAITIPAAPQSLALPEGVTLESPSLGPLVLVAAFFAEPPVLADVEATLLRVGLAGVGALPGLQTLQQVKVQVVAASEPAP